MAGSTSSALLAIFQHCQVSTASHSKHMKTMNSLFSSSPRELLSALIPLLNKALVVPKSPCADRVLDLVAKFTASPCDKLASKARFVLHYLVSRVHAKNKNIRTRCCLLIAVVLRLLAEDQPQEGILDAETVEVLVDAMLTRSKDKIVQVRVHAIGALERLQSPEDSKDVVLLEILRALNFDGSKEVRTAALMAIGITELTVPFVVARCRDTNDQVRLAAYRVLRGKIEMRAIKISDRVEKLFYGLCDRNPRVKLEAQQLLVEWFTNQCGKDVSVFMQVLNVDLFYKECEFILSQLVQVVKVDNQTFKAVCAQFSFSNIATSPIQDLSVVSVFILNGLLDYFKKSNDDETLEKILGDAIVFSDYFMTISHVQLSPSVCQELARTSGFLDAFDEAGMRKLAVSFQQIILTVDPLLKSQINAAIPAMIESLAKFNRLVPIFKIISQLDESQDEILKERYFLVVERSLALLDFEQAEAAEQLKSVIQLANIAKGIPISTPGIRALAIKCLNLYSVLTNDSLSASNQIPLLVNILRNDHSENKLAAIQSLMDLVLHFDLLTEIDSQAKYDLIESVHLLVHDESDLELQYAAAVGLSRILFHSKMDVQFSSQILSTLLMLFVKPECPHKLRQFLAVFFPNFSSSERSHGGSENMMMLPAGFSIAMTRMMYQDSFPQASVVELVAYLNTLIHSVSKEFVLDTVGKIGTVDYGMLEMVSLLQSMLDIGLKGQVDVGKCLLRTLIDGQSVLIPQLVHLIDVDEDAVPKTFTDILYKYKDMTERVERPEVGEYIQQRTIQIKAIIAGFNEDEEPGEVRKRPTRRAAQ